MVRESAPEPGRGPAHPDARRGGLNAQCAWIPSGAGLGGVGKNRLRVATSRLQPGLPEQERDVSNVHLLSKPPWAVRRGPPVPSTPRPAQIGGCDSPPSQGRCDTQARAHAQKSAGRTALQDSPETLF